MGDSDRLPLMMLLLVMLVLCGVGPAQAGYFSLPSPWGYRCQDYRCVKEVKTVTTVGGLLTLNQCKLTCGPAGVLWPQPTEATLSKAIVQFMPNAVTLSRGVGLPMHTEVFSLVGEAFSLFRDHLNRNHPDYYNGTAPWGEPWDPEVSAHNVNVVIIVTSPDVWLTLTTDESYKLEVATENDKTTATITATTFFGARNGLETLTQLVEYHETQNTLMMVTEASITDKPAFLYRGLLLDTSRNFFSVASIKRTLDAMAANKLNTLHWHITDSQAFPLFLESLPYMAYYGAYSPRAVYHPNDIKQLVHYARVRGIRLVPEIGAPAHEGSGWQWGEQQGLGNLAVCVNREPWAEYCYQPPCGQLNIANPNMYKVLGQIYQEVVKLFEPLQLFHFGGDEVNLHCWNTTEEVVSWMTDNNYGVDAEAYYDQWGVFQEKARKLLQDASGGDAEIPGILWTSHLTQKERIEKHLDKSQYIIQIWSTSYDPRIADLLTQGYKVILSNHDAWYLDCGFGAWVGEGGNWCSPYNEWQRVYDNSPHAIANNLTNSTNLYASQILGGEAELWSEQVDEANMDAKLWPRGAALAERLWTNPSTSWREAELRLIHHRQRLLQRGVQPERIQPQWCHQNEGLCYRQEGVSCVNDD